MRLDSARQMWHDATKTNCVSSFEALASIQQLGVFVQSSDRDSSIGHAIHSTLAGHVQAVIDKLPPALKAFGNVMYAAECSVDEVEEAWIVVFNLAYEQHGQMYVSKYDKALYVARGVFDRYKRMHQGGQSSNVDPLPSAKSFRSYLLYEYGIELSAEQWAREWQPFIQYCFDACSDLDKAALSPVGALRYSLKEVA